MTPSVSKIRAALKEFDFETLFIETLGWDRHHAPDLEVHVDCGVYHLHPVAQKRGMVAYLYDQGSSEPQLDGSIRRKIDVQVRKAAHEHLIIYADSSRGRQVWQWVRREPGLPSASREHVFARNQQGDALIQKLQGISFSLDEEDALNIGAVAGRAKRAFDLDRVTKRFYDRFKSEHAAFLSLVKGIQEQGDREWYASMMLNRLMFVYFIQRKGFLDGDRNYLRSRLVRMRTQQGPDRFHTFYRHFLMRLFHEGLGQDPAGRTTDLDDQLGEVPYLNGGLFDVHELEQKYTEIDIPDSAFEAIFDFFDRYEWHLDTRPLHSDNEINPDVLGYIFEKYVNQKQMGAYYTKEDITEYIARSTVIPRLLDTVGQEQGLSADIVALTHADPDRYLFDASNAAQRSAWNRTASPEFGLPSETWRELVERRRGLATARELMSSGVVESPDDFVRLNLDLRQLAQDLIDGCSEPSKLLAFYRCLTGLTVLDPTCGSGAFLFAVLNVMCPLYEACLDRAQALLDDQPPHDGPMSPVADFQEVLSQAERHVSRRYFVLKSIILNNLYGVDIMEEAVEICKLRLFLKLAGQIDSVSDLEPLPDIDFNIRSGNALVGFASREQLADALSSKLDLDNSVDRIDRAARIVDESYRNFRALQSESTVSSSELHEGKQDLQRHLISLKDELDTYLAADYGHTKNLDVWRRSHQPFHWFLDFYGTADSGGFDVVLGNPPYVEYKNVRSTYTVRDFATLICGDLYALVLERGHALLKEGGRLGMIVPVSITGTDGFEPLRQFLLAGSTDTYYQGFAERPSKLFTGVEKRLAIWLLKKGTGPGKVFASRYRRWLQEERPHLFMTVEFADVTAVPALVGGALPKVHTELEVSILRKLERAGRPLALSLRRHLPGEVVYYTRKVRYFVVFLSDVPRIVDSKARVMEPSELKELIFADIPARDAALAALNSSLFFWFFSAYSDVRNVNRREIELFRIDLASVVTKCGPALSELAGRLMRDFEANSIDLTSDYGAHGVLTIQTFQPRGSKPIIDEIDTTLADAYEFTDDELDFIINHDVKYRLGAVDDDD